MATYYKCPHCGHIFHKDDAVIETIRTASLYGVSVPGCTHTSNIVHCPWCGIESGYTFYIDKCIECKEEIHGGAYFFDEWYCLECITKLLSKSEKLIIDFINFYKPEVSITLLSMLYTKSLEEIILTFEASDKNFIHKLLEYLEKLRGGFCSLDILNNKEHATFKLCSNCARRDVCQRKCSAYYEYVEYLDFLKALSEF